MKFESHKQIPSRIAGAERLLASCSLCPRKCGIDRIAGETGYCGLDAEAYCFREMRSFNEEQMLLPSQHVYFAGCNLRCAFCSVSEWNRSPRIPNNISTKRIINSFMKRRRTGTKTVILIGGEPSISVLGVLNLLSALPRDTRVVMKTNMFFSPAIFDLLDGLVDIYVADFKCWGAKCSKRLLECADYTSTITGNLRLAQKHADLIIRHLIIPGHVNCCTTRILKWIHRRALQAKVSLKGDYVPSLENSSAPSILLTESELAKSISLAQDLDLKLVK